MSDRAKEFLDHWESEHVRTVQHAQKRDEAGRLARESLADAKRAGISEKDLEDAADGDLFGNMLEALEAAANEQMGPALRGNKDEAAN
jgi:hypothetical protein